MASGEQRTGEEGKQDQKQIPLRAVALPLSVSVARVLKWELHR